MGGVGMRFEFNPGMVFKARVRTNMVVVTTLGLDDGSRRSAGTEPLKRQALPGSLVDHGEVLEKLRIGAAVEYEVVGPCVVRGTRRKRACAGRCHATPWMPPGHRALDVPSRRPDARLRAHHFRRLMSFMTSISRSRSASSFLSSSAYRRLTSAGSDAPNLRPQT